MGKEQIRSLDESNYQLALATIKSYIGESYKGVSIENHLALLHTFFTYLPSGCNAKDGIILALTHIKSKKIFSKFIRLQEPFISMRLRSPESDYGLYEISLFELLALNPYTSAAILDNIYDLYDVFEEKVTDIIYLSAKVEQRIIGCGIFSIEQKKMQATFFLNRLQNYCTSSLAFFHAIRSSMKEAGSFLPTSGDFHNGGKSPLIFEYNHQKYVYKPRDMTPDCLIADCMRAFQNLFPEELNDLKWIISTPFEWDLNLWIVPFETKVDNLSHDEACKYFKQFGALLCFAKLFGVGDLHYENIMATADGPVIVDAECVFDKTAITSITGNDSLDKTLISYTFDAFIKSTITNATFKVDGNFFRLSAFKKEFWEGFQKTCQILQSKQPELTKIYKEIQKKQFSYRWVPVATNKLYTDMFAYNTYPDARNVAINSSLQAILNKIQKTFQISVNSKCRESIITHLQTDFFNGDIPFFSFFHSIRGHCSLWMDGSFLIDLTDDSFASLSEFTANLQWLAHFSPPKESADGEDEAAKAARANEAAQVAAELESLLGFYFK